VNIEDGFRDLAPLDPTRDAERWERMVAGITAAAAPELARRARLPVPGMMMLLADWVRPTVSAAALMAAAAGAFLVARPDTAAAEATSLASELGYSSTVATWADAENAPSVEEMMGLEGVAP
jgi:L-fucose isomerase-like protein